MAAAAASVTPQQVLAAALTSSSSLAVTTLSAINALVVRFHGSIAARFGSNLPEADQLLQEVYGQIAMFNKETEQLQSAVALQLANCGPPPQEPLPVAASASNGPPADGDILAAGLETNDVTTLRKLARQARQQALELAQKLDSEQSSHAAELRRLEEHLAATMEAERQQWRNQRELDLSTLATSLRGTGFGNQAASVSPSKSSSPARSRLEARSQLTASSVAAVPQPPLPAPAQQEQQAPSSPDSFVLRASLIRSSVTDAMRLLQDRYPQQPQQQEERQPQQGEEGQDMIGLNDEPAADFQEQLVGSNSTSVLMSERDASIVNARLERILQQVQALTTSSSASASASSQIQLQQPEQAYPSAAASSFLLPARDDELAEAAYREHDEDSGLGSSLELQQLRRLNSTLSNVQDSLRRTQHRAFGVSLAGNAARSSSVPRPASKRHGDAEGVDRSSLAATSNVRPAALPSRLPPAIPFAAVGNQANSAVPFSSSSALTAPPSPQRQPPLPAAATTATEHLDTRLLRMQMSSLSQSLVSLEGIMGSSAAPAPAPPMPLTAPIEPPQRAHEPSPATSAAATNAESATLQELDACKATIIGLNGQVEQLRAELEATLRAAEASVAQASAANERCAELEALHHGAQEECSKLQAALDEVRRVSEQEQRVATAKVASAAADLEETNQRLAATEASLRAAQERCESLEQQAESMRVEAQHALEKEQEARAALATVQGELAALRRESLLHEAEQAEEAAAQLSSVEQKAAAEHARQAQDAAAAVAAAEGELSSLRDRVVALTASLMAAEGDRSAAIEAAAAAVAAKEAAVSALESLQKQEASEDGSSLLQEKEAELARLREEHSAALKSLEEQVKTMEAEAHRAETKAADVKAGVAAKDAELASLRGDVQAKEQRVAHLEAGAEDFKQALAQAEKALVEAQAEIIDLSKRVDEATAAAEAARASSVPVSTLPLASDGSQARVTHVEVLAVAQVADAGVETAYPETSEAAVGSNMDTVHAPTQVAEADVQTTPEVRSTSTAEVGVEAGSGGGIDAAGVDVGVETDVTQLAEQRATVSEGTSPVLFEEVKEDDVALSLALRDEQLVTLKALLEEEREQRARDKEAFRGHLEKAEAAAEAALSKIAAHDEQRRRVSEPGIAEAVVEGAGERIAELEELVARLRERLETLQAATEARERDEMQRSSRLRAEAQRQTTGHEEAAEVAETAEEELDRLIREERDALLQDSSSSGSPPPPAASSFEDAIARATGASTLQAASAVKARAPLPSASPAAISRLDANEQAVLAIRVEYEVQVASLKQELASANGEVSRCKGVIKVLEGQLAECRASRDRLLQTLAATATAVQRGSAGNSGPEAAASSQLGPGVGYTGTYVDRFLSSSGVIGVTPARTVSASPPPPAHPEDAPAFSMPSTTQGMAASLRRAASAVRPRRRTGNSPTILANGGFGSTSRSARSPTYGRQLAVEMEQQILLQRQQRSQQLTQDSQPAPLMLAVTAAAAKTKAPLSVRPPSSHKFVRANTHTAGRQMAQELADAAAESQGSNLGYAQRLPPRGVGSAYSSITGPMMAQLQRESAGGSQQMQAHLGPSGAMSRGRQSAQEVAQQSKFDGAAALRMTRALDKLAETAAGPFGAGPQHAVSASLSPSRATTRSISVALRPYSSPPAASKVRGGPAGRSGRLEPDSNPATIAAVLPGEVVSPVRTLHTSSALADFTESQVQERMITMTVAATKAASSGANASRSGKWFAGRDAPHGLSKQDSAQGPSSLPSGLDASSLRAILYKSSVSAPTSSREKDEGNSSNQQPAELEQREQHQASAASSSQGASIDNGPASSQDTGSARVDDSETPRSYHYPVGLSSTRSNTGSYASSSGGNSGASILLQVLNRGTKAAGGARGQAPSGVIVGSFADYQRLKALGNNNNQQQ